MFLCSEPRLTFISESITNCVTPNSSCAYLAAAINCLAPQSTSRVYIHILLFNQHQASSASIGLGYISPVICLASLSNW